MHRERVAKGRWQTLNNAEKFFTIVIALSIVGGFSLLAIEASGLTMLTGFLG